MTVTLKGVESCNLIDLPKFTDARGNLAVVESSKDLPFEIKRVFYLYDVPQNTTRAAHAHSELVLLIIPLSGSFDVVLDDGKQKLTHHLKNPSQGLFISPMVWHELENFAPGSVCLVLASKHYDEADYFRNYNAFLKALN
jgi:dTDP-4-dehydrorhamnose 3,5-epimerase-like enzyme